MTYASQIDQIPPAEDGGNATHRRARDVLSRSSRMLDGVATSAASGNSREFYNVLTNVFDACGEADYVNNFTTPQEAWRRCSPGKRNWWLHSCANRIQQDESGGMQDITDNILQRPDRVWGMAELIAGWVTCARRDTALSAVDQYDRATLTLRDDANTNDQRQLTVEEIYSRLWLAIHPTIQGPALEAGLLSQRTGLLQALQSMPRAAAPAAVATPATMAGIPTAVSGRELVRSFAEPAYAMDRGHGPSGDHYPGGESASYSLFVQSVLYARRFALQADAPVMLHRLRAHQMVNPGEAFPAEGTRVNSPTSARDAFPDLWRIWRTDPSRMEQINARWWILDHPYTLAPEGTAERVGPQVMGTYPEPAEARVQFGSRTENPLNRGSFHSLFPEAVRYARRFALGDDAPTALRRLRHHQTTTGEFIADDFRGDTMPRCREGARGLWQVWYGDTSQGERTIARWYLLDHAYDWAAVQAGTTGAQAAPPRGPREEPAFVQVRRPDQSINRNPEGQFNNPVSGYADALRYAKDFDLDPGAPMLLRQLANDVNNDWQMPDEPNRGLRAFWLRATPSLYRTWEAHSPEQRAQCRWWVMEHPRTPVVATAAPEAPKPAETPDAPEPVALGTIPDVVNRWRMADENQGSLMGLCRGETNGRCSTCDGMWESSRPEQRQAWLDAATAWALAHGDQPAQDGSAPAATPELIEQITQRVIAELRSAGTLA